MKTLIDIRANFTFDDLDPEGPNSLKPIIQLVIAYRNGKAYKVENRELIADPGPIEDIRFLMDEEMLKRVINRLKDWQSILKNRAKFVELIRPAVEEIIHKNDAPAQGETKSS